MTDANDILLMNAAEPFEAHLDHVDWTHFSGWAYNPAQPDVPVWLEVIVDDAAPIRFLANMLREDLAQAGVGTGRYGFHLYFSRRLDSTVAHRVMVRRVSDGAPLHNAPWRLPAAPAGSAEARARFEAVFSAEIEAASTSADLLPLTRFLVAQTDRLLQAGADLDSGRTARRRFRTRWAETIDGAPQSVPPPDPRPLALVVGFTLPHAGPVLTLLAALAELGFKAETAAMHGLPTEGPAAEALVAAGHTVLGAPWFSSIEDILRRTAPDFRVVVLCGAVAAAAYAVTTRLHHPRARVLAWLDEPGTDMATEIAAQLLCDAVLAPSAAAAEILRQRLQGRPVHVAAPDGDRSDYAALLRTVLAPPLSPPATAAPAGSGSSGTPG
jgi:hypothetical protein